MYNQDVYLRLHTLYGTQDVYDNNILCGAGFGSVVANGTLYNFTLIYM